METKQMLIELQAKQPKLFSKYYKAMSYRILDIELIALYNVLILKTESTDELTNKWEQNVKRILELKEFIEYKQN